MQFSANPSSVRRLFPLTSTVIGVIAAAITNSASAALPETISVTNNQSSADYYMAISGAPNGSGGGALSVQGADSADGSTTPAAADALIQFQTASTLASSLNAQYGVGDWAISNVTLTLQAMPGANNATFGQGSGNFAIYLVANNAVNTATFATTQTALNAWAGSSSLLATPYFNCSALAYDSAGDTGKCGYGSTFKATAPTNVLNFQLANNSTLTNDIETGSAISLDLLPVSSTVGMTFFNFGNGANYPTLSFEVVAVPEPQSYALVLAGLGVVGMALSRQRRS